MKNFTRYFIGLILFFNSFAYADYATTKRITVSDLIQGSVTQENYIKDSPPKAGVTKGWSCYADAAGSVPVDGTGGSPTGVTWTATSTTPLKGPGAFVFTKSGAANKQGMGCSYNFTIDKQDRAKVLGIEAEYLVDSGTFTAGTNSTNSDIIWYIYDVTNAKLIEPSSIKLLSNSTTLTDAFKATFQTSSDSVSYRLIAHVSTTTTNDFALKFGGISVSRSSYPTGTPITDWIPFTPTGSWTTNTTYTGKWRRVGDLKEYQYDLALTGAPTATNLSLNLPSGDVIDTSKLVSALLGVSHIPNSGGKAFDGVSAVHNLASVYGGTTAVRVAYESTATGQIANVTQAAPFTFNSGDTIQVSFAVPIVGLSSSVQMSDSADTRVVAMKVFKTSNQSLTSGVETIVISWGVAEDTHGAFNTTTGIYTAPVEGWYEISGQVAFAANATGQRYTRLVKNGLSSDYGTLTGNPYSGGDTSSPFAFLTKCAAGTTLSVVAFQNSGGALNIDGAASTATHISIKRVTGPSAIAANESVNLRYTNTAGTSIANSGDVVVPFATKDFDSHGSWVTDTFTAQTSGKYEVNAKVSFSSVAYASGNRMVASIYKNGSFYTYGPYSSVGAAATLELGVSINDTVSMLAGDTLQIRVSNNRTAGATTLGASANSNSVNIKRVGN